MNVMAVARRLAVVSAAIALLLCSPFDASAQVARTPVSIEGYGMYGRINFSAAESFDAIVGDSAGPILGGGVRIGLGLGGLFFDVGAWRFQADGERVLVANDTVFPLGIPVTITVRPLEMSGGWQFRFRRVPKLIPYVAGGITSMHYEEASEFSTAMENTNAFFNGFHVLGGAQYKITRWLGVAGEASWTTVPDALGEGGVSDVFNETDLGGTTFRFKITIGR
jgi:hypothetical protein